MKFTLSMISAILMVVNLSDLMGQNNAMFEMPIYFEDALGNRDTIIIGGDTTAIQGINPQFGEVEYPEPFNSIFEVRATNIDGILFNEEAILTKKIIGWTEPVFGSTEDCEIIESAFFVANISHFPLTIYWDNGVFKDSLCILHSYLSSSLESWLVGEWVFDSLPDYNTFYCMADSDSIALNINNGIYPGNTFEFIYPIEGGIKNNLYVFYITFSLMGLNSPCVNTVGTSHSRPSDSLIHLYPNPCSNFITADILYNHWEIESVHIIDIYGNIIHSPDWRYIPIDNNKIEVFLSHLPSGAYFIHILGNSGTSVNKFIKI